LLFFGCLFWSKPRHCKILHVFADEGPSRANRWWKCSDGYTKSREKRQQVALFCLFCVTWPVNWNTHFCTHNKVYLRTYPDLLFFSCFCTPQRADVTKTIINISKKHKLILIFTDSTITGTNLPTSPRLPGKAVAAPSTC
jgi:hypothetical protein